MDLDHFKSINDSFGHLAGDFVLRKVAQIARSTAKRPGDLIGRFGGEEFLILLPKTGEEQAAAIAETIRANIEAERILVEGLAEPVRVTASFGIAIWNGPHAVNGHSRLNMIDKADKALYRAKNAGRNTVRFADQSVST
jgi:diguanylate cyclase (GGDEF)-like protein